MNYEIAVLAALVQLDKPTRPKITMVTGISAQKINSSIKNLRVILDIGIHWVGALKLITYKRNKEIEYDSALLKKLYAEDMKLHNYRHSLKLEGFNTKYPTRQLTHLNQAARKKLRDDLKMKFALPSILSTS
jgi:cysteinyl-tRNA synthetase